MPPPSFLERERERSQHYDDFANSTRKHSNYNSNLDYEKLKFENERLKKEIVRLNSVHSQQNEKKQQQYAIEIEELKKTNEDLLKKYKIQTNLYENIRMDRNLISSQQIENEDEKNELKRKFLFLSSQILQLKEEISNKDFALISHFHHSKKSSEELKNIKRKLSKKKELLNKVETILFSQEKEIFSLRKLLNSAEICSKKQQRLYEEMVGERDILGCQLMKRNDELSFAYEKLKILEEIRKKGEDKYEKLFEVNKKLQLQNEEKDRKIIILNEKEKSNEKLTRDFIQLQKDYSKERNKVKLLSEELENPLNIHRWRAMEGNDPKKFELITKIQILQKSLIKITEKAIEYENIIKEKEKLIEENKVILARNPGPEVYRLLAKSEQENKDKLRQLQANCAEINFLQVKMSEYKYEKDKMAKELTEMKKRWLEVKRKDKEVKITS